nr:histidine kinase [Bifidobacterium canis]
MARQEQIASQIHDALSAELSYLMLHMRRNAADPQFDEKSRAEFASLAQNAGDALRKVRDIVHDLSPDEQTTAVSTGVTDENIERNNIIQLLREDIEHSESMLRDLGFTGSISVRGDLRTLPTPALEFARTVLTELVANIIRHGEPAHYLVQIYIDSSLRIESRNRVRTASQLPHSGHGVAALRRAVAQHHGTVTAQLDGDTWHTVVTVPLPFFPTNIYTGRKG